MNKQFKVLLLVTVVFVLGVWILIKSGDDAVAPVLSPDVMPTAISMPNPSPSSEPPASPMATPTPTQQNNVVIVTYTNSGYSPSTVTIKKGQTVTWKNQSSSDMWTASAMHPSHKVYPGTDIALCGMPTFAPMFDSCTGISFGQSWLFKFDNTGVWKYHNHRTPSHFGTIVVE